MLIWSILLDAHLFRPMDKVEFRIKYFFTKRHLGRSSKADTAIFALLVGNGC